MTYFKQLHSLPDNSAWVNEHKYANTEYMLKYKMSVLPFWTELLFFVCLFFFFKLWAWPDMSSLLQHLEEHQSKHQVGLTRGGVLMEQEKEGTSASFLADSWDKLRQDGRCLKGTVNLISAWFQKVWIEVLLSICTENCPWL